MDREQARREIRRNWRRIIEEITESARRNVNGEKSWICPLCGNGSGSSGDGLTINPKSKDRAGLHCFKCGFSGDIIDLFRAVENVDYNTALSATASMLGVTIDQYRPAGSAGADPAENRLTSAAAADAEEMRGYLARIHEKPAEADFSDYYDQCRQRLTDPAAAGYLQRRGISIETAAAYWIGFDPAADPAGAPAAALDAEKQHPCPRIIIPTSGGQYIGRSVDPAQKIRYVNSAGGRPATFNGRALYAQDAQEIFITEGAFDALSIMEAGAPAAALNSVGRVKEFLNELERERARIRPGVTLILCLDNDEAGRRAAAELGAGLQRLNIAYVTADICGGCKDPNEALAANRAAFFDAVAQARGAAARPDNAAHYIDALMIEDMERCKDSIKTGFAELDRKSGGLNAGLYVIAAISSLGKTSFALQLADQIAAGGGDVVFFSLEQSRLELVSKSLARTAAQIGEGPEITSLTIRRGYNADAARRAAAAYKAAGADRVSIIEGNFACNVSFIGDYLRSYVQRTGSRPAVIVDYLQILQPATGAGRQTSRESIDSTITELKRISRELEITVIAISSVNRANYSTPIDFESLKESGGIEFTADVILGLQLECLNEPLFDKQNNIKERRERVKEAKKENPRKIELVCLKNRYGIANYSCSFNYYPAQDLFEERPAADPAGAAAQLGGGGTWQRL